MEQNDFRLILIIAGTTEKCNKICLANEVKNFFVNKNSF